MFNGDSRIADKFVIRMPEGMRERIAEIAKDNHRSMNSEIIRALESLVDDSKLDLSDSTSIMATCMEEVHALHAFRKMPSEKRKAMLILLESDQ